MISFLVTLDMEMSCPVYISFKNWDYVLKLKAGQLNPWGTEGSVIEKNNGLMIIKIQVLT